MDTHLSCSIRSCCFGVRGFILSLPGILGAGGGMGGGAGVCESLRMLSSLTKAFLITGVTFRSNK